jgi:hypothetical protein
MLNAVRLWILFSTSLVCAGWFLSALGQLNRAGYGVVLVLIAAAGFLCWEKNRRTWPEFFLRAAWKFKRRCRHPLPLLFMALAVMALVGGLLYVSSNNDSNEYRIPRVWHWLAQGRWHWIHTMDDRMNIAGNGFEWLAAPFMVFTRTDRCNFLINWISYLMLPGLIFSVFTRLGVRPRVAYWWMWLLASGWCYAMQAGSTANDSFAVIYALAAVDLALRAREKNSAPDFLLSLLAAALLTGAKQTNIPLVALWAVAAWPGARLLTARPKLTLLAVIAGLVVSCAPMIFLNLKHTGSWVGVPPGSLWSQCALKSPFWGVVGNAFCIPQENLQPPYLPDVDAWNAIMHRFLETPFGSHFNSFEQFGHMAQGASEADAGIGLWIVILTLISIWGTRRCCRVAGVPAGEGEYGSQARLLRWLPWLALLVFMAKVGTYPIARQLAAYYVFLFPSFLVWPGQTALVRRGYWQKLAMVVMLLTAGMQIVARNRPLFPAETILLPLRDKHPGWKFLAKAWDSYACRLSVDTQRHVFQNSLPADETVVGYVTFRGSQETGLWLPFGRRRVQRILPDDTPQQVRAEGIHYVVLDGGLYTYALPSVTIADWTNRYDGVLVDSVKFETQPGKTGGDYLVRLNPAHNK